MAHKKNSSYIYINSIHCVSLRTEFNKTAVYNLNTEPEKSAIKCLIINWNLLRIL